MHFRTHRAEKHKGKSNGQGEYNDVMVAHDEHIGEMLKKLDALGIADDTIVLYSTDNGPHYNSWPDAGITPFRSEKNTNWEGGWRVPAFVRWPRRIKPGVLNDIVSHQDWLPTLLAAAGEPDIVAKLRGGHEAGDKTFKVCADGFNMLPYFTGEAKKSPRQFFFYISDDGDILAIRMGDWKVVLMEQRAKALACWFEPLCASGRRRCSICDGIRSSGLTRARTPIGIGCSHTPTSCMRCRTSSPSRSTPSWPFRRVRSPPRSTSTRSCASCRKPTAAPITNRPNPERSPATILRCARRADFGYAGALVRGSP